MTVRNTNYSSLEEVWGDTQPTSSSSKTVKRKETSGRRDKRERTEIPKVVDPICELYEMGNYRGYNENDIISYANEYHDKLFQKEFTTHKQNSPAQQYPSAGRRHVDDNYEGEGEFDVEQRPKPEKIVHEVETPRYRRKVYIDDDEREHTQPKEHNEFAFIDLLLYIVSGIILIFVMEQFVKIGILLQ